MYHSKTEDLYHFRLSFFRSCLGKAHVHQGQSGGRRKLHYMHAFSLALQYRTFKGLAPYVLSVVRLLYGGVGTSCSWRRGLRRPPTIRPRGYLVVSLICSARVSKFHGVSALGIMLGLLCGWRHLVEVSPDHKALKHRADRGAVGSGKDKWMRWNTPSWSRPGERAPLSGEAQSQLIYVA